MRRQWYLQQQQQAILNAQASGQAVRQNAGLGRGLVIPGGPNARPMPIRPNTGTTPVAGSLPIRLPNGTIATPEQVQQLIQARQMALASQGGSVPQTTQQLQRMVQARATQQAQLTAQQVAAGGQAAAQNTTGEFMPFNAQQNGATTQGMRLFFTKTNNSLGTSRESRPE